MPENTYEHSGHSPASARCALLTVSSRAVESAALVRPLPRSAVSPCTLPAPSLPTHAVITDRTGSLGATRCRSLQQPCSHGNTSVPALRVQ
jgi:hypothetical protein